MIHRILGGEAATALLRFLIRNPIENCSRPMLTRSIIGLRRRNRLRRGFFDSQSKTDESDSWISNKTETALRSRFRFEKKSSFNSLSRDKDRDTWGRKKEEGGNESEAPRARPRLVLQPRTVPVSEGGARPAMNGVKPKGASPFGEARPREDVLSENGKDWKEIAVKLETVKIKEEKTDTTSFGRRGFGNGKGWFAETRSWIKNESGSLDATQQSAENGQAEDESENGYVEEKSENGHTEENLNRD